MAHRVLILEDDAHMRGTLTRVLEDEDYEVGAAASAPEAIAMATRADFDLMVTDVRMEGMDGLECLAALRQVRPGLKSIVITGYASQDAPSRALQVGAEDYLYKPFQLRDFLTSVQRVLNSGQEREGHQRLLAGLLGGFKKMLDTVSGADKSLRDLEELRNLAYQSMFVGIRSGKLKPGEAMAAWDRLEQLDGQRELLKNAQLSPQGRQELGVGYQYLIDMLAALSRTEMAVQSRKGANLVPEQAFLGLFHRVKEGLVSCEQLKLAAYLRSLERETLQASPMLVELHAAVWDG